METWTAIAAIAASLQTIGVLGALWYARRQYLSAHEIRDADRRDAVLNRLDTAFHEQADPAIRSLRRAIVTRVSQGGSGPGQLHDLQEHIVKSAGTAQAAMNTVGRLTVRLGDRDLTVAVWDLQEVLREPAQDVLDVNRADWPAYVDRLQLATSRLNHAIVTLTSPVPVIEQAEWVAPWDES